GERRGAGRVAERVGREAGGRADQLVVPELEGARGVRVAGRDHLHHDPPVVWVGRARLERWAVLAGRGGDVGADLTRGHQIASEARPRCSPPSGGGEAGPRRASLSLGRGRPVLGRLRATVPQGSCTTLV